MPAFPRPLAWASALLLATSACAQTAPGSSGATPAAGAGPGAAAMTFFVTSAGTGKGADLGGLDGADKHCQTLATAAGAGQRTWRAYLSTNASDGGAVVHARDRIGRGPWRNAKGTVVAKDIDDLHGAGNQIGKQTALSEKGDAINGRGDSPNMHDILTGSTPDGRAGEATCKNWTSSAAEGSATVGHHDRTGLDDSPPSKSWNASHPSRGCSQDALKASGGAGLLYCFATD